MKKVLFATLAAAGLCFSAGAASMMACNGASEEGTLLLSQNSRTSSSASVRFNSPNAVMAWLSGKTFYSDGYSLRFSYDAVYVNGSAMTAAPVVKRFTATTATIEAHSPYMGMSKMTFYLDAERGTVRQANDIYYLKK